MRGLWNLRGVTTLLIALGTLTATAMSHGVGAATTREQAAPLGADTALFRYYPETGHNLGPPFKDFYEAHGGLAIFGLPLTEVVSADVLSATQTLSATSGLVAAPALSATQSLSATRAGGSVLSGAPTAGRLPLVLSGTLGLNRPLVLSSAANAAVQAAASAAQTGAAVEVVGDATQVLVQYFERARLEYHLDAPDGGIVVADLGRRLARGRGEPAFAPQAALPGSLAAFGAKDITFFPETDHTLRGSFRSFWEKHGGLAVFGYPLSEITTERDASGAWVTVQYFERARLEYRPQGGGVADGVIQVGLLGREYLAQRPLPAELLAPAPQVVKLAAATTPYYPGSKDATNILLAAQRIDGVVVEPGATHSFLSSMGEISEAAGFVSGAGIVGDKIVPVLAGGICQVSSALYVAAFDAGFEIAERHNHSRFLSFFADRPGVEAAVYSPDQDLRWRNDSAYPIHIQTTSNAKSGLVTVALWGVADGRTTQVARPQVGQQKEPGPAEWSLDETLAAGEVRQVSPPQQGLSALVGRVVAAADGSVLHADRVSSVYAPAAELLRYGKGIQPPAEGGAACLLEGTEPVGELAKGLRPCAQATPSVETSPTTEAPSATPEATDPVTATPQPEKASATATPPPAEAFPTPTPAAPANGQPLS